MAPVRGTVLTNSSTVMTLSMEPSGRLLTLLPLNRWLVPFGALVDPIAARVGQVVEVEFTGSGVDLLVVPGGDLDALRTQLVPAATPMGFRATEGRTERLITAELARRRRALAERITSDRGLDIDTVRPLLGLGPGTTPAGDDTVVGMLAVLRRFRHTRQLASAGSSVHVDDIGDATTQIAAEMLYHATHGAFPEPLSRFASALGARARPDLVPFLADLYSLGSTSGRDMAHGALGLAASLLGLAEQQLLDHVDQRVHAHGLAHDAGVRIGGQRVELGIGPEPGDEHDR